MRVLEGHDALPVHTLKQLAGFTGEDKAKFDRGLVELQTGMFITMCGRQQKRSKLGKEYGWSSTVFCTTERFFGDEVFETAAHISEQEDFKVYKGIALHYGLIFYRSHFRTELSHIQNHSSSIMTAWKMGSRNPASRSITTSKSGLSSLAPLL